jgi:hypothetical protein
MQDVYAVLREKELAIERVRREIEALRVVCQLLAKEEGDFRRNTMRIIESNMEPEDKTVVVFPADHKKVALAQIQARFLDARLGENRKENGRSALLQFRQSALGASQTFLKRVRNRRVGQRETQRNTIRDLLERFARSNAA